MVGSEITFVRDICEIKITSIQGIYFTRREIDVMACLVNSRGTSKTASLLSIAPKTAVNHIHNIMQKIDCNARDSIIDFVERSHTLPQLRSHYSQLLTQSFFEKCLKDISKSKQEKNVVYLIAKQPLSNPLLGRFVAHLKLLGLEAIIKPVTQEQSFFEKTNVDSEATQIIYFLKEQEFETFKVINSLEQDKIARQNKQSRPPIILVEKRSCAINESYGEMVSAGDQNAYNYYITFFDILSRIFSSTLLEKKTSEFRDFYKSVLASYKSSGLSDLRKENSYKNNAGIFVKLLNNIHKKDRRKLLVCAALGIIGLPIVGLNFKKEGLHLFVKNPSKTYFQSNIIRFPSNALLERQDLKAQLKKMFTNKSTIQTIALLGIGGSGKTTLARQYVTGEKASIKWEFNSETLSSLQDSCERLARTLAVTKDDKIEFEGLQAVKDANEREQKILTFIQKHLKYNAGWLLIYDNVENLSAIQKYFPSDVELWGNGHIILTTRDATVQNNSWLNGALQIKELTSEQKYEIFTKIADAEKTPTYNSPQAQDTRDFLENIPPYPLDISLAAYYLKSVNSTYRAYLNILKEYSHEFDRLQQDILTSAGNYNRTRYGIISSSLHKIMSNSEFTELLLFISVINSRNISKSLLESFKKTSVVDPFIYHLKKYSLITYDQDSFSSPTFSIHKSIQELFLAQLVETLRLKGDFSTVQKVLKVFEAYIDTCIHNDDITQIIFLIDHAFSFYQKKHILNDAQKARLATKIAWLIRRGLGDNKRAEAFLEESLGIYNKNPHLDPDNLALVLGQLGYIERKKGNYAQSVKLLAHSLAIYKERGKQFNTESAYLSVHLGISYRYIGDYKKAEHVLKNAKEIYKNVYGENDYNYIWAVGVLGNIFNDTGQYTEACVLLEKAFSYISEKFGLEHVETMITAVKLGASLREIGDYASSQKLFTKTTAYWKKMDEKSKSGTYKIDYASSLIEHGLNCSYLLQSQEAIERISVGLKLIKEHYGDNNIKTAWAFACLGKAYGKKGDFKAAKSLLLDALSIYEKSYGSDHLEIARIQRVLGEIHFQEGLLKDSENYFNKALQIFIKNNCSETCLVLECLAELCLLKANKLNIIDYEKLQKDGYKFLKQALDKVRQDYPSNSPHFIRIHNKFENLIQIYNVILNNK